MEGRGHMRSGGEGKTNIKLSEWGMSYGMTAVGDAFDNQRNIQGDRTKS